MNLRTEYLTRLAADWYQVLNSTNFQANEDPVASEPQPINSQYFGLEVAGTVDDESAKAVR